MGSQQTTPEVTTFVEPPPVQFFPVQQAPMPKYNPGHGNWNKYLEKLETWFKANGVTNVVEKRVLLMDGLNRDTQQRLKDQLRGDDPQTRTYQQLCSTISKIYSHPVSMIHERRRFYGAFMGANESVHQWFQRIKRTAAICQFGDDVEKTLILDKFVTGLIDNRIVNRIGEENLTTLTINQALEIARNYEAKLGKPEANKKYDPNPRESKPKQQQRQRSRPKQTNNKTQQD